MILLTLKRFAGRSSGWESMAVNQDIKAKAACARVHAEEGGVERESVSKILDARSG